MEIVTSNDPIRRDGQNIERKENSPFQKAPQHNREKCIAQTQRISINARQ